MRHVLGSRERRDGLQVRPAKPRRPVHLALEALEERTVPSRVLLWVALDPTYPGGGGGINPNVAIGTVKTSSKPSLKIVSNDDSDPIYYADSSGVGNWAILQYQGTDQNGNPIYSSNGLTNTVNPGDALIFDPALGAVYGTNVYQGSNAPCDLNMPGYLPAITGSLGNVFNIGQMYIDLSYTSTISNGVALLISNPGGNVVQSPGLGGTSGFVMENGVIGGQPVTIDGAEVSNGAGGYFYTTGYWYYGTISTTYFNIGYVLNNPNGGYTFYNDAEFWINALGGAPSGDHYLVADVFTNYSTAWWLGGNITLDDQSTLGTTWGLASLTIEGTKNYIYSDYNNDNVWNYGGTLTEEATQTEVEAPFENQGDFSIITSMVFDVYAWQNGGTTTLVGGKIFMDGNPNYNGTTYWDPLGTVQGYGAVYGNLSTDSSFGQDEGQGTIIPSMVINGVVMHDISVNGNIDLTENSLIDIMTSPTGVPRLYATGEIVGTPGALVVAVSSAWLPAGEGPWMIVGWDGLPLGTWPNFVLGITPTATWTIGSTTYVWGFDLNNPTDPSAWQLTFGPEGGGNHHIGGNAVLGGGLVSSASADGGALRSATAALAPSTALTPSSAPGASLAAQAVAASPLSAPLDPLVVDALMAEQSDQATFTTL